MCDNVLMPQLDKRLIYDNAASRKGKGTHFAMDRLTEFIRKFHRRHGTSGYILKCDISKYFDRIDHDVLLSMLGQKQIFDARTMWLIEQIIKSYQITPGNDDARGE